MGDPGKLLQQQRQAEQLAPKEMVPEPGRQTLVQAQQNGGQNMAVPIGNQFVDNGALCAQQGATGNCFLDPDQRDRLVDKFGERVLAAQIQYVAALGEMRVDELLRKDPEGGSIWVDLILEVIVAVTIPALGRAMSMLRTGAAQGVWNVAGNVSPLTAGRIATTLRSDAGKASIDNFIKAAVTKGKTAAIGFVKDHSQAKVEAHDKKQANVGFIDVLTHQSAGIYQDIRENAPAGADDGMLAVLFQAFDWSMGHTKDEYKAQLQAKLARFEKSGVGDIGVTGRDSRGLGGEKVPSFAKTSATGVHELSAETRVFRVMTPIGPRMALYRRDYYEIPKTTYVSDTIGGHERPKSPLEIAEAEVENAKRDYTFVRYVPPEFESVAVAMHRSQWGSEPIDRSAKTPEEIAQARVTL